MESDFTAAAFASQCYKAKGDFERMKIAARRALDRIEKIVVTEPGHSRAIGIGVNLLAVLGEKERAKEWATRARLVDPENANLHYNLACAMASLGEIDLTLETLAGIAPRLSSGMLSWMEADTDFDAIREEPRFRALVEQVKARLAKP
jgi:adenylate cyclase